MSLRIVILAFILMAPTGCADLSGEGDVASNTYETFDAAAKAGVFEAGWLPRTLPRSAVNISEVHNIDTSELWVRFSYSGDDIQALVKECRAENHVEFPKTKRTKRNAAWWPDELTKDSDPRRRARWTILSCPSMRHAQSTRAANIAFDPTSRTAWYWLAR